MNVSAIIPSAGQSKRMGRPKLLLPWGNTTVLGKVIETVQAAGVEDILVITGGAKDEVEKIATHYKARVVYNENFENDDMLGSIQLGLSMQKADSRAALICLADHPQVEAGTVRAVVEAFRKNKSSIVVPSYQMRRGHPWLIGKELWPEVLQMTAVESMRGFLNKHKNDIFYVDINSPSILQDLDTPEDYLKLRP